MKRIAPTIRSYFAPAMETIRRGRAQPATKIPTGSGGYLLIPEQQPGIASAGVPMCLIPWLARGLNVGGVVSVEVHVARIFNK